MWVLSFNTASWLFVTRKRNTKRFRHTGNLFRKNLQLKDVWTNFSTLTHLFPRHPFSSTWKHQKTVRFSDVFRCLRKDVLWTNTMDIRDLELPWGQEKSSRLRMFEIAENSKFLPSIRHYCIYFYIDFGKSGNRREKVFWYFYSNCNNLNLCKSFSIRGQLVRNHCILVFSYSMIVPVQQNTLFLIHVEMVLLGTAYFSATSLFERPFSSSLKAWNFSPKLFTLSCRLTEDMSFPERMLKKRKSKLPNNILSMQLLTFECLKWTVIHSKTSFECSK